MSLLPPLSFLSPFVLGGAASSHLPALGQARTSAGILHAPRLGMHPNDISTLAAALHFATLHPSKGHAMHLNLSCSPYCEHSERLCETGTAEMALIRAVQQHASESRKIILISPRHVSTSTRRTDHYSAELWHRSPRSYYTIQLEPVYRICRMSARSQGQDNPWSVSGLHFHSGAHVSHKSNDCSFVTCQKLGSR